VIRFGVLLLVVDIFVNQFLIDFPLTDDFSDWYANSTIFVVAVILALTAYAFRAAVAGRPFLEARFLDPD
jgi:hypothetical protein